MSRVRVKLCDRARMPAALRDRCQQEAEVMYRVKVDESEQWIFVCDRCYPAVSQNNPHYIYGGTWKAQKPR